MTTTSVSTAPVAARPSRGAATYGQVRTDAIDVSLDGAFAGDQIPPGHFGIVVRNHGGVQTYYFRGSFGDLNAQIVARTQHASGQTRHYIGGSIDGGSLVPMARAVAA
ncbi:hypothetical protein [Brachybacterium sacelli]|uniref:Uncharacterized protein n=1 Tax=Brachybacterium sacelli TaxID=173364 RepID=A0ABS4X5M9_9MICO|nr:hypothetical protein [Brachybacterium sacelli]MBP2383765.1 hypothetical protein [Brachybacterium sacelli]